MRNATTAQASRGERNYLHQNTTSPGWGIILFSVWIHSLYLNAENNIVLYIVLWVNWQSSSWKPKFVLKRFTFEFKFCHYLLTLMLFQTHMTKTKEYLCFSIQWKWMEKDAIKHHNWQKAAQKQSMYLVHHVLGLLKPKWQFCHHLLVLMSYQIHLASFLSWNTKGDILKNVQAVLFHSVKIMLLISTTTKKTS